MKKSNLSILGSGLFILLLCVTAMGQRMSLVSVNSAGTGSGENSSTRPSISADGRYIAFQSEASNIVPNDTNGIMSDVFVRDTIAGTTSLVSVSNTGEAGNGSSGSPVMSANGQFVTFVSNASNLASTDNNTVGDIFVRNLLAGTTSPVTVNSSGTDTANNVLASMPQISADGRFVAFLSLASNLVPNDTNGYTPDVFVRDTLTGTTTLVSANLNGGSGNSDSSSFVISANGRYVAFESYASDLVARDGNNTKDVFVRDLFAGTTALVSVNVAGKNSGNGYSLAPSISADGRLIAFMSAASDLTANDTNGGGDVFLRDIIAKTTTLITVNREGNAHHNPYWIGTPVISADGRVVLFMCADSDLVEHDDNSRSDFFVRDLMTATTRIVSAKVPHYLPTVEENNRLSYPDISADGRFVVFAIPRDSNAPSNNVYVRDLVSGSLTLVNLNSSNTGSSNEGATFPVMSADGRFIAFQSMATDLGPIVTIFSGFNVFVFHNTSSAFAESSTKGIK